MSWKGAPTFRNEFVLHPPWRQILDQFQTQFFSTKNRDPQFHCKRYITSFLSVEMGTCQWNSFLWAMWQENESTKILLLWLLPFYFVNFSYKVPFKRSTLFKHHQHRTRDSHSCCRAVTPPVVFLFQAVHWGEAILPKQRNVSWRSLRFSQHGLKIRIGLQPGSKLPWHLCVRHTSGGQTVLDNWYKTIRVSVCFVSCTWNSTASISSGTSPRLLYLSLAAIYISNRATALPARPFCHKCFFFYATTHPMVPTALLTGTIWL